MPATLAVGLQGGETLHTVQEVGAQGAVGTVAVHAALLVPAVEDRRSDEGEEGETEEDKGDGQVQDGHENEDENRGDCGNDDLGEVLAEEGLQALDAVAEGEDDAAGATLVEVTRAKG